ncbi:MAG: hypothetical protein P1V20_12040 [Verrucomicrobiales bacterium]|nr:hypothetical protein [Verrucomicrobiales bacterium]
MPNFHRIKCDHCGFKSEPSPESYLALELDKPTGLDSSPSHPDNPADIIIPNPGAKICLEAHGFTFKSAMKDGRIVKYIRKYCRECGAPFEFRKYYINGLQMAGCLTPVLVSLVPALLTGLLSGHWYLGIIAFLGCLGVTATILGFLTERMLSKNHAEKLLQNKDIPRCPHCASIETTGSRIKCPECGFRSGKLIVTRSK